MSRCRWPIVDNHKRGSSVPRDYRLRRRTGSTPLILPFFAQRTTATNEHYDAKKMAKINALSSRAVCLWKFLQRPKAHRIFLPFIGEGFVTARKMGHRGGYRILQQVSIEAFAEFPPSRLARPSKERRTGCMPFETQQAGDAVDSTTSKTSQRPRGCCNRSQFTRCPTAVGPTFPILACLPIGRISSCMVQISRAKRPPTDDRKRHAREPSLASVAWECRPPLSRRSQR